jgi:hypothetical protein
MSRSVPAILANVAAETPVDRRRRGVAHFAGTLAPHVPDSGEGGTSMSRSSRLLVAALLTLVVTPAFAFTLDARSFGKFISKYACAASPTSTAEVAACKPKALCRFPSTAVADQGHLGFLIVDAFGKSACVIPSFDSQGTVNGVVALNGDFELVH